MTVTLRGLARCGLWISAYVLLVLFPVPWLGSLGSHGAGFTERLGAVLGHVCLSILAVQVVLTARFRLLTPPFGADVILAFHRGMAGVAVAFALLHPLLAAGLRGTLAGLVPWGADGFAAVAGAVAFWALAALVVTSAARAALRFAYVPWRAVHEVLSAAVVILGLSHATSAESLSGAPVVRAALWVWYLGWIGLLGWARLVKPALLLRRRYRVTGLRPEHGGAVTLVLDPEHHGGLRFRAGQFAFLTLGGSPLAGRERACCFSGSAQRTPQLEFTVKDAGELGRRARGLKPGALAYVDGPLGWSSLDAFPDADRYFLVAIGLGIAPCISILRTLADRGDRRPHTLVYGTHAWEEAAFREELAELASRIDLKVVHVLERPSLGWLGETGVVGRDLLERHLPRGGRLICFVAGETLALDGAEEALSALGVPLEDIHTQRLEWA